MCKIFNQNIATVESNAISERKDALTNRPLDLDREEETRRKETFIWLDNHFGSECTSKDSKESISDIVVEPTKKSFFNVTIKSNNLHNLNNTINSGNQTNNNLKSTSIARRKSNAALLSSDKEYFTNKQSKVNVSDIETTPTSKRYFQGISDWSERKERKESPRPLKVNPLSTKAFRDELSSTLTHKQKSLRLQGLHNVAGKQVVDTTPTKIRSASREDLLRLQKEDLGYLSGSRTDLRSQRKYTNKDYAVPMKKRTKEDLQSSPQQEHSFGHEDAKQTSIQRDDSAYVSSSTYFTTPRSPHRPRSRSPVMKTPDSGIRFPTPNIESDEFYQSPPAVPQRKKAIERKNRVLIKNEDYANYPAKPRRDPPIDYSPSPHSDRSLSPLPPIHHVYSDRKPYQRSRFSSSPLTPTNPTPTQTQTITLKKKTVGNAIGNSLRKLVGKIRSVSAERKLKAKASSISSKRSPSPLPIARHKSVSNLLSPSSSYQRNDYIIDGHISANGHSGNKHHSPSTTTQGKPVMNEREVMLSCESYGFLVTHLNCSEVEVLCALV